MEMTRDDVVRFVSIASDIMNENKDYLIELDANSGDGDLGLTMSKGFAAAKDEVTAKPETDLGKLLFKAGSAISAAVPSTMGTLMASGFLGVGKALKGKTVLDGADIAAFAQAYYDGVQKRGKANPGERTLLDSLKPAADKARELIDGGCDDIKVLTEAMYEAACAGVEATKAMAPVYGKAFVHREKLKGVPDQGAIVGSLLYKALKETFA